MLVDRDRVYIYIYISDLLRKTTLRELPSFDDRGDRTKQNQCHQFASLKVTMT